MNGFLDNIKKLYTKSDYELIKKAYDFSYNAHDGQKRESGEEYFSHPLAVATILVDLGMDTDTICAALLHDVLEDTSITEEDIIENFSENILKLVQGVTKISNIKFQFKTREDEQAENWRKMLIAMADDIRIIIIKLADRIHNMRTLAFKNEEAQLRISRETLEIYAPIAARLGMGTIKGELEDTAMKYVYPEEYYNILQELSQREVERDRLVDDSRKLLNEKLEELGIEGEVNGRPKHIYSIFRKMNTGKSFEQIHDLIALRIVVPTIKDCYELLGVIHTIWKPLPGRFKDYIAMPKSNLYQSLHTTVISQYGSPFEIQIRTFEMHSVAEYGIAAHWMYKEKKKQKEAIKGDRYAWIRETLDIQKESRSSRDFLNVLKLDLYPNEIFVFTPNGDVLTLPAGATALDFAYKVHSEIGNKCVGTKVNSKIMPLGTVLKTGDIVEIITSKTSKGPSRDWINTVKTQSAKSKIKSFFKRSMRSENEVRGKQMLEKEARRRGYSLNDLLAKKEFEEILLTKYSCQTLEDLYAMVGFGDATTNQVLFKLIDLFKKDIEKDKPIIVTNVQAKKTKEKNSGILISGYDDFLIRISKCCNPVPGDKILGYVTRGRGICIHREDCPNVKNFEKERIIETEWPTAVDESHITKFTTSIDIVAEDREKLIADLTALISQRNLSIQSMNVKSRKNGQIIINYGIEIKDINNLNAIIEKIRTVSSVIDVFRA